MSQAEGNVKMTFLSDDEGTDVLSPKQPESIMVLMLTNQSFKQYGRREGHE